MMKEEFEKLVKVIVTEKEYDIINTVYTFHPSIGEIDGKKQIAELYVKYGYRVILDMLDTAEKAQEYEAQISDLQFRLEEAKDKFKIFKFGGDV